MTIGIDVVLKDLHRVGKYWKIHDYIKRLKIDNIVDFL
jgi:hypothetical protein